MTNINPDNLIKGEPYLIELEYSIDVGFYMGEDEYCTPPKLVFSVTKPRGNGTVESAAHKHWPSEIESLYHLKMGLKLGDCSVCRGKPQEIMSCPCGKDIPKQSLVDQAYSKGFRDGMKHKEK